MVIVKVLHFADFDYFESPPLWGKIISFNGRVASQLAELTADLICPALGDRFITVVFVAADALLLGSGDRGVFSVISPVALGLGHLPGSVWAWRPVSAWCQLGVSSMSARCCQLGVVSSVLSARCCQLGVVSSV